MSGPRLYGRLKVTMEALLKLAQEKEMLALAITLAFIIYRERMFYLEKKEWREERKEWRRDRQDDGRVIVLLENIKLAVEHRLSR